MLYVRYMVCTFPAHFLLLFLYIRPCSFALGTTYTNDTHIGQCSLAALLAVASAAVRRWAGPAWSRGHCGREHNTWVFIVASLSSPPTERRHPHRSHPLTMFFYYCPDQDCWSLRRYSDNCASDGFNREVFASTESQWFRKHLPRPLG